MSRNRDFYRITLADFIVRSAYQMGKTPLLPMFAVSLGASDILLGFIVSISTMTGMVSKPLVGLLSDRSGRKVWLIIGTAFFAFVPFAYWMVKSPEHLIIVRVIHGLATAVYGPVTLAWISENAVKNRAERLGWFSIARNGGYIVGPALAGWMLLSMHPEMVFTAIGLISCLAFWPIAHLTDPYRPIAHATRCSLGAQFRQALSQGGRSKAVWLSGGLEAISYTSLYALKAFLPVYALEQGYSMIAVGIFFSVQEVAHVVSRPIAGRFSDRLGYYKSITIGMVGMALLLPLIGMSTSWITNLGLAVLLGVSQAVIFPVTTALVAQQAKSTNLGTSMGLVGTLRNSGKVVGPVVGGFFLARFGFQFTFVILSGLLVLGVLMLWAASNRMAISALLVKLHNLVALHTAKIKYAYVQSVSGQSGVSRSSQQQQLARDEPDEKYGNRRNNGPVRY